MRVQDNPLVSLPCAAVLGVCLVQLAAAGDALEIDLRYALETDEAEAGQVTIKAEADKPIRAGLAAEGLVRGRLFRVVESLLRQVQFFYAGEAVLGPVCAEAVGFLGYRLDVVFQFCRLAQDVHSVDKQKADVGRASLVHVLTP